MIADDDDVFVLIWHAACGFSLTKRISGGKARRAKDGLYVRSISAHCATRFQLTEEIRNLEAEYILRPDATSAYAEARTFSSVGLPYAGRDCLLNNKNMLIFGPIYMAVSNSEYSNCVFACKYLIIKNNYENMQISFIPVNVVSYNLLDLSPSVSSDFMALYKCCYYYFVFNVQWCKMQKC